MTPKIKDENSDRDVLVDYLTPSKTCFGQQRTAYGWHVRGAAYPSGVSLAISAMMRLLMAW
jgi:hypothetical protein